MGFFGTLLQKVGLRKKRVELLLTGLDNSGKSTMMQWLTEKSTAEVLVPTVGFNVERFSRGRVSYSVFDMSGQPRYREMWKSFYSSVAAIVFVIDLTDRDRLCVAYDELSLLLRHPDIESRPEMPVLIFCNKADVEGSLQRADVTSAVPLVTMLGDRPWTILTGCAITGDGLEEAVEWLGSHLR